MYKLKFKKWDTIWLPRRSSRVRGRRSNGQLRERCRSAPFRSRRMARCMARSSTATRLRHWSWRRPPGRGSAGRPPITTTAAGTANWSIDCSAIKGAATLLGSNSKEPTVALELSLKSISQFKNHFDWFIEQSKYHYRFITLKWHCNRH